MSLSPASSRTQAGQIDYVEVTANVVVAGTSPAAATTIITGNAVSYDGATAVLIDVNLPAVVTAETAVSREIGLFDGSTEIGRLCTSDPDLAFTKLFPLRGGRRLTPSAGVHTYSVRGWQTGAVTFTLYAGSGVGDNLVPIFIRITRAD